MFELLEIVHAAMERGTSHMRSLLVAVAVELQ